MEAPSEKRRRDAGEGGIRKKRKRSAADFDTAAIHSAIRSLLARDATFLSDLSSLVSRLRAKSGVNVQSLGDALVRTDLTRLFTALRLKERGISVFFKSHKSYPLKHLVEDYQRYCAAPNASVATASSSSSSSATPVLYFPSDAAQPSTSSSQTDGLQRDSWMMEPPTGEGNPLATMFRAKTAFSQGRGGGTGKDDSWFQGPSDAAVKAEEDRKAESDNTVRVVDNRPSLVEEYRASLAAKKSKGKRKGRAKDEEGEGAVWDRERDLSITPSSMLSLLTKNTLGQRFTH